MNLVDTLAWLVDIPSETGQEGRLATALAERLLPSFGEPGVSRIGNSLVIGHRGGAPLISLFGHTDTVPRQGQGPARVEGDRLHGLGSSDMKAGLAVMVHLLEDAEVRAGPFDVIGVFYAAEEGPHDENELEAVLDEVKWLEESELAVVLEPTDLSLELGCQGVMNARVVFNGVAAHSARPWLGENAVTRAGAWLAEMAKKSPEVVQVGGLEFREVVTVTQAHGGVANNIVPARFECNVNYRFAPDKTMEDASLRFAEHLEGADEFEIVDTAPGGRVEEGNAHIERLGALTGAPRRPKQGWTDVARLSARDVPAINYGPGEADLAHTVDESVPVANLDVAFESLRQFLITG